MDAIDWLDEIKQNGGFSEVRAVIMAFDCVRNGRCFRVEITDSGRPDDLYRYMVHVINPNGAKNMMVRGNGDKDILHAIQMVHWSNLEIDKNYCDD